MRILAAFPLALLPLAAATSAPAPSGPPTAHSAPASGAESFDRMNVYRAQPHCDSIPRQVAGEDRDYPGMRLDRQPPGRLLYAVERQVDGCREAVLVSEERRRRRR
ncbi:MAG TPA: hypothetical protein VMS43_00675 [Allosphingosinicella sp.]|nr:hypothetical protein [Allosphingosinicella sp.]